MRRDWGVAPCFSNYWIPPGNTVTIKPSRQARWFKMNRKILHSILISRSPHCSEWWACFSFSSMMTWLMWCWFIHRSWRRNGGIGACKSARRRHQPHYTRDRSGRFPHRRLGHWSANIRWRRAKFRPVQLAIHHSAAETRVQSTYRSGRSVYALKIYLLTYLFTYMVRYAVCNKQNDDIQGGPKKVSHKVLSISLPNIDRFTNFFHWWILWKICSKVSYQTYHHTLTASLHYRVKYKMCKIHQYLVQIWTRAWSLIFWPVLKVKLRFVLDRLSVRDVASTEGTSTSTSTSTWNYLSTTTQVPTVAKAHYS